MIWSVCVLIWVRCIQWLVYSRYACPQILRQESGLLVSLLSVLKLLFQVFRTSILCSHECYNYIIQTYFPLQSKIFIKSYSKATLAHKLMRMFKIRSCLLCPYGLFRTPHSTLPSKINFLTWRLGKLCADLTHTCRWLAPAKDTENTCCSLLGLVSLSFTLKWPTHPLFASTFA